MPVPKWSLSGEYMESCNCDYLCPCIYTNPQEEATHDHCIAVMVFRIDEGSFGATKLDGLKFALVIRSGKVMADGNWIFAGVVDESADEAQRTALAAIVGGDAGGTPAVIRQNLVSDFRGVEFKPIEFHLDAFKRSASIPMSSPSRSRASYRETEAANRSISTIPATPQTVGWHSPGRRKRMSTASASTWTWWARAITDISHRLPGPLRSAVRRSVHCAL
jgi:hypothetical protein